MTINVTHACDESVMAGLSFVGLQIGEAPELIERAGALPIRAEELLQPIVKLSS